MSLNININKVDLQKAIDLHKNIALYKPLGAIYGGVWNYDYEGGWHKFGFTSGYTKIAPFPVFIPTGTLDSGQAVGFGAIFYITSLFNSYVLFNEPAPTYASLVEGFYLYSSGTLTVRSAGTPSGTTSATVNVGDIIVLYWVFSRVSNTYYMQWYAARYDWDTDSFIDLINAYGTVSNPYSFRYLVLWEPNGTSGKVAVGPYIVHWDVRSSAPSSGPGPHIQPNIRMYRSLGLQDPRTLDMTTV
jgi:hypothetical protein